MSFKGNIEVLTVKNNYYRKVIATTDNMQLVLMSLKPGEEIGKEVHPHTSQFIRVEGGRCTAYIGRKRYIMKDGDAIIIPPGRNHNIINTGDEDLKLYSIYTPPEHPKGRKQRNKPEK
jgi:mannose-6-phosphate isomerase-like protein (cupin superfamily)